MIGRGVRPSRRKLGAFGIGAGVLLLLFTRPLRRLTAGAG